MSWIEDIQGLTTIRSALGTVSQRRSALRIGGLPLSDNGTETVLNGVQNLAGAGAWDGVSGIVLVAGSGVRVVTVGDPVDPSPGTIVRFVNRSTSGTLTLDPSGTILGSAASITGILLDDSYALCWIAAGRWAKA